MWVRPPGALSDSDWGAAAVRRCTLEASRWQSVPSTVFATVLPVCRNSAGDLCFSDICKATNATPDPIVDCVIAVPTFPTASHFCQQLPLLAPELITRLCTRLVEMLASCSIGEAASRGPDSGSGSDSSGSACGLDSPASDGDDSCVCGVGDWDVNTLIVGNNGRLAPSQPCPHGCADRATHLAHFLSSLVHAGLTAPANAALNRFLDVTQVRRDR